MERLLLIDGFNLLIGQNAAVNILDFNSEPCGMYLSSISQIKFYVEKFKPTKVIFAMDGPEAGERRRKLYSNYKNKRRVTARKSNVIFRHGETKDEKDIIEAPGAFQKQLGQIYEFLKKLPITIIIIPYCEADDVIAYLANKNKDKYQITIVSTDKDYLQLVDNNVRVYNWRKKKLYTEVEILEEFGVKKENFVYWKIILGDTSDNIDNIKSIGKKTFDAIFGIPLKENAYNNIEEFFNFIDSYDINTLEKKNHKHLELLKEKENRKSLLLNYRLIKLDVSDLKYHHIEILKKQLEEQKNKTFAKLELKVKVFKDGFDKLYGSYQSSFNADKFLNPFVFVNNKLELTV